MKIGVGWLPVLARPVSRRRPTLPYTRRRARRPARRAETPHTPAQVPGYTEDMIFDQPPRELPVATVVRRDPRRQLVADLATWFAARWRWFKPRTVPMIVAFLGMLAVLGSVNWLRNYARRTPERLTVSAPAATTRIQVTTEDATITIDGAPIPHLERAPVAPSHCGVIIDW